MRCDGTTIEVEYSELLKRWSVVVTSEEEYDGICLAEFGEDEEDEAHKLAELLEIVLR